MTATNTAGYVTDEASSTWTTRNPDSSSAAIPSDELRVAAIGATLCALAVGSGSGEVSSLARTSAAPIVRAVPHFPGVSGMGAAELRSVRDAAFAFAGLASADPMARAYSRLDQLAQLPDNWNSYGGHSPTEAAVKQAALFLRFASDRFGGRFGQAAAPAAVAPLPNGGVQLDWRGGNMELELEFGPDGKLAYLFIDGRGPKREFDETEKAGFGESMELVRLILFA